MKNGCKWAKISKLLVQRTEHVVKNRFFSLMALSTSVPIRRLKEEKLYLNQNLIIDSLAYHQDFIEQPRQIPPTMIFPINEENARNQENFVPENNTYYHPYFHFDSQQNFIEQQQKSEATTIIIPFNQEIPRIDGDILIENNSFFPCQYNQWKFK